MKNMYIIPIFIPHLGCPHKCVFCNQNEITGSKCIIDEEFVNNTIINYLKTIPTDSRIEVSFYGGSFTGIPIDDQKRYLNIAKKYLDMGEIDAIRLSTRPDYINDTILTNLKYYGVSIIELGVQSMDKDVLIKSQRGHTEKDVINASYLIKKNGFTLGLQMMIGLPGDDEKKAIKTAEKIISLKPDFVRIYPTLVVKGTYLEKMYKDGLYKPINLNDAVELSKELYIKFIRNNIDVIRIGLQTTKNINTNGDIIAGPFHPAFGQLVKSSIVKDMVDNIFYNNNIRDGLVTIYTNPKFVSIVTGQKKINKKYLEAKYNVYITIRQKDEVPLDDVCIKFNDNIYSDSLKSFIGKTTT